MPVFEIMRQGPVQGLTRQFVMFSLFAFLLLILSFMFKTCVVQIMPFLFFMFCLTVLVLTYRVVSVARTKSCVFRFRIPAACARTKTAPNRNSRTTTAFITSTTAVARTAHSGAPALRFGVVCSKDLSRSVPCAYITMCACSPGTKHPTPPAKTCKQKCHGKTCDEWEALVGQTCSELEQVYKCDCKGCACSSEPLAKDACEGKCGLPSYKADGHCDDVNNNCGCNYDGGQ